MGLEVEVKLQINVLLRWGLMFRLKLRVSLLLAVGSVLMLMPWMECGLSLKLKLEIEESWGSALGWS